MATVNIAERDIGNLPEQLISIAEEIEKSKYILALDDNWDDQGAPGYDFDAWRKAAIFLSELSTKIFNSYGQIIKTPKIYHGSNGSIDIYWKNESFNQYTTKWVSNILR